MDLASIERACQCVLGGVGTAAERAQAQQRVLELGASIQNIATIQAILDGSNDNYAVVVAAQSLLKLVTDHWNSFSEPQHVDIRNYLLNFLASKGPRLQQFAVVSVVQLLCRITKYAWFDESSDSIRQIVAETRKFLAATAHHCAIGLRILFELVHEVNFRNRNRTLTQHRKVAVSFRDTALFPIFEIGLSMANNIATRSIALDGLEPREAAALEDVLLDLTLSLLSQCLSFDFIGTNPDESSDEVGTIQVPAGWRDRINTGSSLRLLFNVYKGCTTGKVPLIPDAPAPTAHHHASPAGDGGGATAASRRSSGIGATLGGAAGAAALDPSGGPPASTLGGLGSTGAIGLQRDFPVSEPRAKQALEVLTLLVSVRRSIFNSDADRRRFLAHILRGICDILREEQGLRSSACYHEFARLLSRCKINFQLSELIKTEGYAEWVELLAAFTLQACAKPLWSGNALNYVLSLWARLVASVPYVRLEAGGSGLGGSGGMAAAAGGGGDGAPDTLLDAHIPRIVSAYVRGRMESLTGPDAEEALAELDDLEALEDQLEQLPSIARFAYEATARELAGLLDPLLARYTEGSAYMMQQAAATRGQGALPDSVVAAVRITECQLAWCVAIVGAIVSGFGSGQLTAMSPYYLLAGGVPGGEMRGAGAGGGGSAGAGGGNQFGEEAYDADLCQRVFKLVAAVDSRVSTAAASASQLLGGGATAAAIAQSPLVRAFRADARLESALLYFLGNFRKVFLNEQAGMPTAAQMLAVATALQAGSGGASAAAAGAAAGTPPKPHPPASLQDLFASSSGRQRTFYGLFLRMGLGDHSTVVTLALTKLFNNLRFWLEREDVVKRSLDQLHELVYSYASGKLLLSLDFTARLLVAHGPAHFPFLGVPGFSRLRTVYYASLARLVFSEDKDDVAERLEPFLAPILEVCTQLAPVAAAGVRSEEVMRSVIGVCRDLRGVLSAAHNRATYVAVFEALYPAHLATLSRCMATWADTPPVTNALLKFTSELVYNRAQRVVFGSNSAGGILLFREASAIVQAYGRKLQFATPSVAEAYALKFKGLLEALRVVNRCLDGGYVNFGVFALYGDAALESVLDVMFKTVLPVPLAELMSFPKLAQAYLSLLHLVLRSHMEVVAALPQPAFLALLSALREGLDSLDSEVSNQAAAGLDHLASFFVRHAKRLKAEGGGAGAASAPAAALPPAVAVLGGSPSPAATMAQLRGHFAGAPGAFESLMKLLFRILVFGEAPNQWALARPLLPLMLAAELERPEAWEGFRGELVAGQPSELRGRMAEELERLMKDVTRSLDVVNRDRFAQRLTVFRLAVREGMAT